MMVLRPSTTHRQSTRSRSSRLYDLSASVACFWPSPHFWLFVPLLLCDGPTAYSSISSLKTSQTRFAPLWSLCSRPLQPFSLKDEDPLSTPL
jgi:hypothetical protein